ncbi:regulator of G-protein signaling 1 [Selaginella moellendorffii]|uniref:regulator of G-protein signaling 1 n=1 Tax=Selaginella moellendorffii TaxID=88036 RepID=UPI000D1D1050|nr:regulator of G-protein signaling 1 [Selaginella moellendorffii]|eukprot:XP_024545466.1 regulator of G-protein signaling 1 [Selaginella moellendorffii]
MEEQSSFGQEFALELQIWGPRSCKVCIGICFVSIKRRQLELNAKKVSVLLVQAFASLIYLVSSLAVSDHDKRSPTCQFNIRWELAVGSLYALYPAILLLATWKVRHIRFEFDEFKELLKAASICALMLGNLTFRSVSVGVLFLFWIPIAKPVHDLFHGRRSNHRYSTMGQALGVPVSGAISQPLIAFNFNRPLELLLEHRSRMAGEVVHFYSEVRELNKLQQQHQVVQRIYMAEHIIDKYIKSGWPLFSEKCFAKLFKLLQNLSNDYWQSEYFQELKDELDADVESQQTGDDLEQQLDVTATKRALRRLYDPTPDNPFDQGCPFSGELRKENQPEQHHTGVSQKLH